jgi:DNA-binding response OmpR family regulator
MPRFELLRLHLDLAGFTIDESEDRRTALDRARSTPFELVLLDIMLPGLDGVSVCRASVRVVRVVRS